MNLTSSSSELSGTVKKMRLLWEETKTVWSDSVRHDFDENQWRPLHERVLGTLRAMERLAPILDKVQRDCG